MNRKDSRVGRRVFLLNWNLSPPASVRIDIVGGAYISPASSFETITSPGISRNKAKKYTLYVSQESRSTEPNTTLVVDSVSGKTACEDSDEVDGTVIQGLRDCRFLGCPKVLDGKIADRGRFDVNRGTKRRLHIVG